MTQDMSLLEFLRELLTNVALRDSFSRDPQATLRDVGLDKLSPADVRDALVLNQDNQTAPFGRHSDAAAHHPAHVPAPPTPQEHGSEADAHQAAVEQLRSYVTNNYVDNRATTVDDSVHQRVDTHGGNFDQNIDVHSAVASGDGATAIGGSVDHSTIASGHDNQLGNGNVRGEGNVVGDHNKAVTGSHDTTSFGSGATVGDGAAFGSGSPVAIDNADRSRHDVGTDNSDHPVRTSTLDPSDHSVHDAGTTAIETGDPHPSWHETVDDDHNPGDASTHLDPAHLPI
jgi:hypothetical protein